MISYIDKLNAIASMDCLNVGYMVMPHVALATAWFSKIKLPGRELPVDSLWQVEEKKVMQDEDYDLIIEKGYNGLYEKIFPMVVDRGEFQEFIQYNQENGAKNAQKYMQAGYPVITGSMISPPFEILCDLFNSGHRGGNGFGGCEPKQCAAAGVFICHRTFVRQGSILQELYQSVEDQFQQKKLKLKGKKRSILKSVLSSLGNTLFILIIFYISLRFLISSVDILQKKSFRQKRVRLLYVLFRPWYVVYPYLSQ